MLFKLVLIAANVFFHVSSRTLTMCCSRRRYCVVLLGFLGLLISIGSREVFTMVVTHVITHNVSAEGELSGLSICVSSYQEEASTSLLSGHMTFVQRRISVGATFLSSSRKHAYIILTPLNPNFV